MTTSDTPHVLAEIIEEQLAERPGLRGVLDWVRRYLIDHPIQSLATGGSQVVLGIRAIQYLFLDLFTGRFLIREYLEQTAFVAGTAFLPTVFVTIPVGVTLSIRSEEHTSELQSR